jgi:hypothetical protein
VSLTEKMIIDQLEITNTNHIQVRKVIMIIRDEGLETETIISQGYHREVIEPFDLQKAEEVLGEKINIAKAAWNML